MNKEERLLKLKNLMKDINKDQKENVLNFASDEKEWERQPSGVESFDVSTGGGFPFGHCSVVWGSAGSGKSSLMYSTVATAQKNGKIVAFLDLENSFNTERASLFGVKCDELIIGHYSIAEDALDTIIKLSKEQAVDVIILDSIHGLSPKQEQEDKKGDKSVSDNSQALLARKLGQFFRMASTYIYKANIALILIGQTRTNLGGYVALQSLSGGMALLHNSLLTIHVRRGQNSNAPEVKWKEAYIDPDGKFHLITKKEPAGFEVVAKIDKKQVSGGQNEKYEFSLPYYFETGFFAPDSEGDIIKIAPEMIGEQKEECRKILVERGYKQFGDVGKALDDLLEDVPYTDNDDESPEELGKKLVDETLEKAFKEEKPKKSKRGRPKKNATTP